MERLDPDRSRVSLLPDGRYCYRASAFGSCIRALALEARGEPGLPDSPFLLDKAEEGKAAEDIILERVRDLGWEVDGGQTPCILDTAAGVVAGTADGIAKRDDVVAVVDAKTMSPARYQKWVEGRWKSEPKYAWQLSLYAAALGKPWVMLAALENEGYGSYGRFDVYLSLPPYNHADVVRRLIDLQAAVRVLPSCDIKPSIWCNFRHWHEDDTDEITVQEAVEMAGLLATHQRLRESVKKMLDEADGVKTQIDMMVGKRKKLNVQGYRVVRVDSTVFDQTGFRMVHPELYDSFRTKTVTSLRISGMRED